MKATESQLLTFLKNANQFAIPIYQRTYSWTERECRQLWSDVLKAGRASDIETHFIGSVVYIANGPTQVTEPEPLLVIDGQQRLTTVVLLLEALARHVGDEEPIDGLSAAKIRTYYLRNELEKGERSYKLLLTQTDRESLIHLLDKKDIPGDGSIRLEQNFQLLTSWLAELGDGVTDVWLGLKKLLIVDVSLDRHYDNPQLIFESMNSTGLDLSQADLIRNFVLMGLEIEHQKRLYNDHWRPMELEFGQEAYSAQFDAFMRHYLTVKTGEIPRKDAVYEAFKRYSRGSAVAEAGVDALVQDVQKFASYFCAMSLGKETDPSLAKAFQDLRELTVDVAYPFLLEVYSDMKAGLVSTKEMTQVVRLVESYVFRRGVCAIPTNSLNKTFATFSKNIRKERYVESIIAHFLLMPSYRRFPGDEEFKREFSTRDLYNFPRRMYWLRKVENFDTKEPAVVDACTIEHIMPQKDGLTAEWQLELGPEWERVHQTKLHTLGNLTLTGYNPEMSFKSFREKRDMAHGFRDSSLRLNKDLRDLETWNEAAIDARAEHLAEVARKVWVLATLPDSVLATYKPSIEKPESSYTIDTHAHLAPGSSSRALFDALRRRILALDDVVTEEFLKLYVAYKAETNFVDVIPRANSLTLTLNIPFHDLIDPSGSVRDVSNIGTWGNGDAEYSLMSSNQIDYAMGLIRQAFDRQMSESDGA